MVIVVAVAWDPPAKTVAWHSGVLAESLNRGRHSAGTTPVRVQLDTGRVVVAQGASELYGSPAGRRVLVQELKSLIFRRPAFLAVPAPTEVGPNSSFKPTPLRGAA